MFCSKIWQVSYILKTNTYSRMLVMGNLMFVRVSIPSEMPIRL